MKEAADEDGLRSNFAVETRLLKEHLCSSNA